MKLIIPAALERKLNAYVQAVDVEIAGMGAVEMREDGNLWVTDIAIYDQEVTGGTADLSTQALARFQTDLVNKGISPKNWYLWWHSHVNMAAYFSTIDTGTMDTSDEFDHLVSLVVNKRRERKCRLDTHRPFRLKLENVPVEVAPEVNKRTLEIDDRIWALIEEAKKLEEEKNAIEYAEPEGIKEEVAQKVKIKTIGGHRNPAGYGQQRNNLNLPYSEDWSKKRKKDGTVSTPAEIIASRLDPDELEVLIENTQSMIKVHEVNGNGDTIECIELRADLEQYQKLLDDIAKEEDSYKMYWNGYKWVYEDEDYNDYAEGYGENELPPLPGGYKYGFTPKDDERA